MAALAFGCAQAADAAPRAPRPSASASASASARPASLNIQGVSVEVQPLQTAPGHPAAAPAGAHVEQPPSIRTFRPMAVRGQARSWLRVILGDPRPEPSASPARAPAP